MCQGKSIINQIMSSFFNSLNIFLKEGSSFISQMHRKPGFSFGKSSVSIVGLGRPGSFNELGWGRVSLNKP